VNRLGKQYQLKNTNRRGNEASIFILLPGIRSDTGFVMNLPLIPTLTVALFSLSAMAQGQAYLLKPFEPAPGQTVVARSSSDASGGQITVTNGSSVQKGSSTVKRKRTFERRLVGIGPTAKLEYIVLIDQTYRSTVIAGSRDDKTHRGELVGQIVYGLRDDINRWRLFLRGKTASRQQAAELVELESYENRQWFKAGPVRVGETWTMEPSFIRNFIERDMGPALMDATMTFKGIEMMDGERTAVLRFRIKTQARKEDGVNFRSSSAVADLNGTLYISLATMLDKKMTMTGTLTTIRFVKVVCPPSLNPRSPTW